MIERHRTEQEKDKLMWFCEECNHKLHEEEFLLEDIVSQLKVAIESFMGSEDLRTCSRCGTVMEAQ